MEGITFKFLAKRRKEEGPISSLLVAEYRQKVQEFEAGFLAKKGFSLRPWWSLWRSGAGIPRRGRFRACDTISRDNSSYVVVFAAWDRRPFPREKVPGRRSRARSARETASQASLGHEKGPPPLTPVWVRRARFGRNWCDGSAVASQHARQKDGRRCVTMRHASVGQQDRELEVNAGRRCLYPQRRKVLASAAFFARVGR